MTWPLCQSECVDVLGAAQLAREDSERIGLGTVGLVEHALAKLGGAALVSG